MIVGERTKRNRDRIRKTAWGSLGGERRARRSTRRKEERERERERESEKEWLEKRWKEEVEVRVRERREYR